VDAVGAARVERDPDAERTLRRVFTRCKVSTLLGAVGRGRGREGRGRRGVRI
jgi:hypothetical protein